MESLALAFSSGWASGINAYLVVLVLGVADRVSNVASIPDALASWPVLIAAGVLFAVESIADKVPYLDSTWDAISTFIRPTVGAVIGVLVAGEAGSLNEAVGGLVGGSTALAAHATKAGSRLAINTSPEPVSNVMASVSEDIAVFGVAALAVQHPQIAASIAAVLLILGLVLLYVAARFIRRGWQRWKSPDRKSPWAGGTGPTLPGPA